MNSTLFTKGTKPHFSKCSKVVFFDSMSRLSIDISPEQHQKIKALAALQGKSLKAYVLNKLFEEVTDDEQKAMGELKNMLLSRIKEVKQSALSSKTIQQISEEVIRSSKI